MPSNPSIFAENLFTTDAEGWVVQVGYPATKTVNPDWPPPVSGFASRVIQYTPTDSSGDGGVYMAAPASYLKDLSNCYGARLDYQISLTFPTWVAGAAGFYRGSQGLILVGAKDALFLNAPVFDGTAGAAAIPVVQSVSITLNETSNCILASANRAPTPAEFKAVLAGIQQLLVRIGYYPGDLWTAQLGAVALYQQAPLDPMLAALRSNLTANPHFNQQTLTTGVNGEAVLALITATLGLDSLDFDPQTFTVTPDPATSSLLVAGTATNTILNVSAPAIAAVFQVDAIQDVLTVEMTLTLSGWDFPTVFPNLAQTVIGNLDFTNDGASVPSFVLGSRNVSGTSLAAQGYLAGLNFTAELWLGQWPVNALIELITGTPGALALLGPAALNEPTEMLSLRCQVGSFSLDIPIWTNIAFDEVEFVVEGYSAIDQGNEIQWESMRVESVVTLGNPTGKTSTSFALPLAVGLPMGITGWTLMLSPGRVVPVTDVVDFLGTLAGLNLVGFLPDKVSALSVFELRGFRIGLTPDRNNFQQFYCALGTAHGNQSSSVWTILDGVLALNDLEFELLVTNLNGTNQKAGTLRGTFSLGGELDVSLAVPLPLDSGLILLSASSSHEINGFGCLSNLLGGQHLDSFLPTTLTDLTTFYLNNLTVAFDGSKKSLSYIAIDVQCAKTWVIVEDQVKITGLSLSVTVDNPLGGKLAATGYVSGVIMLGQSTVFVQIGCPVAGANWELTVLSEEIALPSFGDLANLLDPNLCRMLPPGLSDLSFTIYDLNLDVDITAKKIRQFAFTISSDQPWPFMGGRLTVEKVGAGLTMDGSGRIPYTTGYLFGQVLIVGVPLELSATKSDPGWVLSASLQEGKSVPLLGLLDQILKDIWDVTLPDSLMAVMLTELSFTYDTADGSYAFAGGLDWVIAELPDSPKITASLSLNSTYDKDAKKLVYNGAVQGTLNIDQFAMTVGYQFATGSTTLSFEIQFKGVTFTAVLAETTDPKTQKSEKILTVHLGGVNFGDILDYLVNLVEGGDGFTLSAPWDVLYQLSFDNLTLVVNLTTKSVSATYPIQANLGIMDLESISLTYAKTAGQSSVSIALAGTFLGTTYTDDDPLGWDLLNESPPVPAGAGEQLLDLRYLGFGQNITFRETKTFLSISDVLAALKSDFLPPPDDETNPLVALPDLKFSGAGNWLIGADFTLMSALSIAGIFNDPSLYGIRIGLAGPKVKSLAGLHFEILYRKITDTIGEYHIELTLPSAMRQLQFGAVAITVPTITLDIYTNGNFLIDFGFPANLDFSQSFCVQAGPFIGYGGFYFGVLDGATSDQVPAITNGNFSPVIVFGLGLSVGLGRTFDKGPLSAALTLTLEGLVEGVFGWFNPNDQSASSDLFYRIQGTVRLVGKLHGAVDFVVIKATLDVIAEATVSLIIESYQPIEVDLSVHVEVSASIRIIGIKVSFSFGMTLDFSFQIGDASSTPWILQASDPAASPLQLRQQRTLYRRRALRPGVILRTLRERAGEQPVFDWTPRRVVNNDQTTINLFLVPSLTPAIASKVTAAVRRPKAAAETDPAVQIVMALFIPTATPSEAQHADEVRRFSAPTEENQDFNNLAIGVFRWVLASLQKQHDAVVYRLATTPTGESIVTIADLEAIACQLADRKAREEIFTYPRVTGLIEQNFVLRISNPIGPTGGFYHPGSDTPRDATVGASQAAIFPMIPEIAMTPQGSDPVQFWNYACASQSYRENLEAYYAELQVDATANVPHYPPPPDSCPSGPVSLAARPPGRSTPLPAGCASGEEPLSSILFCDYFALLAQQSVQEAVRMFNAYPYEPTGQETLSDIAAEFDGGTVEYRTRPGDTAGTIAAAFGQPVAEVRRQNQWLNSVHHRERLPEGSLVSLPLGPTVPKIAAANADYPLNAGTTGASGSPGATMTIRHVQYQVRSQDTLGQIASAFDIPVPSDIFTFAPPPGPAGIPPNPNAANTALLRPFPLGPTGVPPFRVPTVPYTVDANDPIGATGATGSQALFDRLAANFFIRSRLRQPGERDPAYIDWYVAAISQNNPTFTGQISIPLASLADGKIVDSGQTTNYFVKSTDTLRGVAAMFELLQLDYYSDTRFQNFKQGIIPSALPPNPVGTPLYLPAFNFAVQAGDSLVSIADTFYLQSPMPPGATSGIEALADANLGNDILQPRAVLSMPEIKYPIGANDTLATVAAQFNLALEDLAASTENDPGIFQPASVSGRRMSIPDVASRSIEKLIQDLTAFGSLNSLSAQVSRFLLNGMRASIPSGDGPATDQPLWGLYDVAGQQFPAPVGATPSCEINFAKGSTAPWFGFDPPVGLRRAAGPSGLVDQLNVNLGPTFFADHTPSTTLDPLMVTGPTAMQMYNNVLPQYGLAQGIHWQAATNIPLAGPTGASGNAGAPGEPSLWLFPQTLRNLLANTLPGPTAQTPGYQLSAATAASGATASSPLRNYSWATAIPLKVTRARNPAGDYVPNGYEMVGADQDGQALLLKAWRYLEAVAPADGTLYLLYPPAVASQNNQGLVSDAIAPNQTCVLKTNLSTATHLNPSLSVGGTGGAAYFAGIESAGRFLKFIWEASVTGTGGSYLSYVNEADGNGLPDEIFAKDNTATLWAILLLDSQTGLNPATGLLPLNNCAVIADNLDASANRIVAKLASPQPADYRRVASVEPGVIGFGLARLNPVNAPGATGATGLTRELYSLVGYQVCENGDFKGSHEGLPVAPLDASPAWLNLPPSPSAHAYWSYQQTIPIAQFGHVNHCPDSVVASKKLNPYRGITGPTGPSAAGPRPLSQATLAFAWHDVYGNETISTPALPSIDVPVGYSDSLINVGSWPGSAFDYLFQRGGSSGIQLATVLSLQPSRYIPGNGNTFDQAVTAANVDDVRYRQIFYQMQQRDVAFAIESNIGTPAVDQNALKAAITAFITKAKLFANAAGALRQKSYTTQGTETLRNLAQTLAVTPGDLLRANKDIAASPLFPGLYVKPNIVPAPGMNTLAQLGAQVVGRSGGDPQKRSCNNITPGDSTCQQSGNPLRVALPGETTRSFKAARAFTSTPRWEDVATDNATQPLTPNTTLRTKPRSWQTTFAKDGDNSLSAVAASLRCNVYAEVAIPDPNPLPPPTAPSPVSLPVGLVVENWDQPGLIADGVSITIKSIVHFTKSDTFLSIFNFYNSAPNNLGLSQGDFAVALANIAGIFLPNQSLRYADFIVPPPAPGNQPGPPAPTFSLDQIPAEAGGVAQLALLNQVVPNIFLLGAPLLLGYSCCQATSQDTPATLAENAGISLDQLAHYNELTNLGANVSLAVPNLVELPDSAACRSTYSPQDGDSLEGIAAKFSRATPPIVASDNCHLPGIFIPGRSITIRSQTVETEPLDSLHTVFARLGHLIPHLEWDAFVVDLQTLDGIFNPNGAIVAPLPTVPATDDITPPTDSPTFEALAASFNIDAVALVETNRSLYGFLRDSAMIKGRSTGQEPPPTLKIGRYDTVETIIRRFQDEQHPAMTVADLMTANAGCPGLMTGDAAFLLPPNPTPVVMDFAAGVPPVDTGEQSMIFPVGVSLKITRSQGLVHPDFIDTDAVFESSTDLVPNIASGNLTSSGKLTLEEFALEFEKAFAPYRLKCAVIGGASAQPDRVRQIWAVNFGPQGISEFSIDTSSPSFYALRPLSTKLVPQPGATGPLTFQKYTSGSGLSSSTSKRFDPVDLDAWLQQFLATIDLFLTPPYAVPAFRLGLTGLNGSNVPEDAGLSSRSSLASPRKPGPGPVGLGPGAPFPSSGASPFARGVHDRIGGTGATAPREPDDYNAIVSAKQTIADALRNNVVPILSDLPGATGPALESAKDALYQQMLIRLGDAYKIDAVVQFPVDITAPSMTGPNVPPRVSGKIVPVLYSIPGGAGDEARSIESVALQYQVFAPYLAQVLGNVRGMLQPGVIIPGSNSGPVSDDGYVTGKNDTINTIAAHFKIPTDNWETWVPFITGLQGIPLFLRNASFPLTGISCTVLAGQSLNDVSEFFGVNTTSVAHANQHQPGILIPGPLAIKNHRHSYDVQADDSLRDIASGFTQANATAPPLTLARLATALAAQRRGLTPGSILYMVESLPEVSLSTAKVSLESGSLNAGSPLSFLLSVKNASQQSKRWLNLRYAINEIEHAIQAVPNAGSYQTSTWLTLVLPIDSGRGTDAGVQTAIPQVQVPIPLRSYPPPSRLPAQSGAPTHPNVANVARARLWDYSFDVQTLKAAQDTDHLRVQFGEDPSVDFLQQSVDIDTLFLWLAVFVEAYPALMTDLARLPTLAPGANGDIAAYAVQALSQIADNVASAFASSSLAIEDDSPGATNTYGYQMTTTTDDSGDHLSELTLSVELGPTSNPVWPASVYIQSPTAPTGGSGPNAGFLPMAPTGPSGLSSQYVYPEDILQNQTQTYRFVFANRDIIWDSTGRGAIAVTRNDRLITQGPLATGGATGPVRTSCQFIYQTPYAQFVDPMVPWIDNDAPIDLANIHPKARPPRPIAHYLSILLQAAMDVTPGGSDSGHLIEVQCAYGTVLAGADGDRLIATTPILLAPAKDVGPGNVQDFVNHFAQSLTNWQSSSGVSPTTGLLIFELSIFTQAQSQMQARKLTAHGLSLQSSSPGPTLPPLVPILRLSNLQISMIHISWGDAGNP